MVQPVDHSFGSETATTVLGGLKGGLFYGALGTVASTVIGAALAATVIGGGAAILGMAFGGGAGATAFAVGAAKIAAVFGGIGGFVYGGATSVIGGAIAGIFEGRSQAAREQGLANAIEREKSNAQGQVIAAARGDAIEQGVTMGYMQGAQDAQASIMNQLAAAQEKQAQARQAAAIQEQDCKPCKTAKDIIAKHEAKLHPASHVEKVTTNAAEPALGRVG